MTKKINQEIEAILQRAAKFPEGATILQISQIPSISLTERSLQRRLAALVQEGRLIVIGRSRARRYQIAEKLNEKINSACPVEEKTNERIPLSLLSLEIQRLATQPIQARIPVGYNWKFLNEYRPNETQYLSDTIREKLYQLGKTGGDQPAGAYAKKIFNRFLIDLSWNSSRLEGNTYSLLETERLLKLSKIVEEKDFKEAKMIMNHMDAIKFLVEAVSFIGINQYTILNLHALLSNNLLNDQEACGRLRSIEIGIGKSVYQPVSIPQLVKDYFRQILDTANAIKNPFEQSFFLMVHLPYLQPFEDVNKRVSRLSANIPLILNNLCPLSFVDVPSSLYINGLLGVYELNRIDLFRDVFVWAYERSSLRYSSARKELGEPDPFRFRYATPITEIIAKIVRERMDKKSAIAFIRDSAKNSVPITDQNRFIEFVEKDLMSIHEGNISIYKIPPTEYEHWQEVWQ